MDGRDDAYTQTMADAPRFTLPDPIIDGKEQRSLESLTARYQKMLEPGIVRKMGDKIVDIVPQQIKQIGQDAAQSIAQAQIYQQMLKVIADGFSQVEQRVVKYTLSQDDVLAQVNKLDLGNEYLSLDELCLARSYTLSKVVDSVKTQNMGVAAIEGGATGAVGFAGLPFSLVLNTFQCFRAVQNVALIYGYDVKNDPDELGIAGAVFANSMAPSADNEIGGLGAAVGKVMMIAEAGVVKIAAGKGWGEMISKGGVPLLIAQMRALANKAAAKALDKAGQQGLEKSIFNRVFQMIGRKLPLKTVQKGVPIIGGVIGAGVDTWQIARCIDYANIFYQKRFIFEKQTRIAMLTGSGMNDASITAEVSEA